MVLKICPICGKQFNIVPSKCKDGVINCCSKSCALKFKWQNEAYREKILFHLNSLNFDINIKNKKSIAIKEAWTKEKRLKQAKCMQDKWNDCDYYEQHSKINKENANKIETRLKKAKNTKNQWKNIEFKEKQRQERILRWKDIEYKEKLKAILSSKEVLDKKFNTYHKNNSFKKSTQEKVITDLLKKRYKDVKYQYKSSLYPFNCDFYIKDIDTYIEFNGYWSHGKHEFGTDLNDFNVLKRWQVKAQYSKHYKNAIYVWTELDPKKRRLAKQNHLNFLEFYTLSDFIKWYDLGLF